MDELRNMDLEARSEFLERLPRANLQKLAKEAGHKVLPCTFLLLTNRVLQLRYPRFFCTEAIYPLAVLARSLLGSPR